MRLEFIEETDFNLLQISFINRIVYRPNDSVSFQLNAHSALLA